MANIVSFMILYFDLLVAFGITSHGSKHYQCNVLFLVLDSSCLSLCLILCKLGFQKVHDIMSHNII